MWVLNFGNGSLMKRHFKIANCLAFHKNGILYLYIELSENQYQIQCNLSVLVCIKASMLSKLVKIFQPEIGLLL